MTAGLERYTLAAGFPIACIGVGQSGEVVLGGGGGAGRSGVQNKLAVYSINDKKRELKLVSECVLSSDEDSPTCLAMHPTERALVCSINRDLEKIKQGENSNWRLFTLGKRAIKAGATAKSICSTSDNDYQRCIAFSPSGGLVAGGSTDGTLAVASYPSLRPAFPFVDAVNEINDVDFDPSGKWLAAATDTELRILSTKDASLVKAIDDPHTRGGVRAVFRFAKFGPAGEDSKAGAKDAAPTEPKGVLYTVLNARSRKGAYIVQWSTDKWTQIAMRYAGSSSITSFALSRSGRLLAFATASLQIVVCDAHSLRVLERIRAAHGFAITALAFGVGDRHLISGSADESCHVYALPAAWPTPKDRALALARTHARIIAVLIVLLVAIILALALRG
ncbi:hypothetical protein LPJ61_002823 [Coemansia biformis]|uniref:WD40 repeat-like protein n=1 Tax=Coemansia biformis TaxID=1286918 RepID=A0A9W7YCK3_9FUNG|nr:hypothetical protein LPJ61_002823 [Coemansia biformis]